ncbi:MAG: hypothetical protein KDJ47_12975 [Hyphomicrobiaceae bacterium]|nr:hypothetical protein [Hyphomicrobiaceae bacterium]
MFTSPYFLLGGALLLAILLWEAPLLPFFRMARSRIVRADRHTVWRHLTERPSQRFVSDEPVPGQENRFRLIIDMTSGRRAKLRSETYEPVEIVEAERYERRIVAIHDLDYTPEATIHETLTLADHPDGTLVTLTQERSILLSISMMLAWRHSLYQMLDYLADVCEPHDARHAASLEAGRMASSHHHWQRRLFSYVLTGFSFLALAYFVDWRLAALLVATIIIHETGHWIAFLIAGHENTRFIPIPFIGGAVSSDRPFRSAREEAFVSLMGPGLSGVFAFSLLMFARSYDANFISLFGHIPSTEYIDAHLTGILLVVAAALVGVANLFQMIPVPPLDGGHVWRALLHGKRRWFVRFVFPVAALVLVGLTLKFGGIIPALAILVLCIAWPSAISTRLAVPVMKPMEKVFMASAYASIVALHAAPVFILLSQFV